MKALLAIVTGLLAALLALVTDAARLIEVNVVNQLVNDEYLGHPSREAIALCAVGSLASLIAYELLIRLERTRECRCRVCHGVLRNLVEPVCPSCGTRI